MKKCIVCGKDHPATAEFFYRHKNYADELNKKCKTCMKREDKIRHRKRGKRKKEEGENKKTKRIDPMPKKMRWSEEGRPPQALDKRKIQTKKYKEGQIYEVKMKPDIRKNLPNIFRGKLIQETMDHVTLVNKKGIRESFLKVDFNIDKRIQELS